MPLHPEMSVYLEDVLSIYKPGLQLTGHALFSWIFALKYNRFNREIHIVTPAEVTGIVNLNDDIDDIVGNAKNYIHKPTILFPVNAFGNHWIIVAARTGARIIEVFDSMKHTAGHHEDICNKVGDFLDVVMNTRGKDKWIIYDHMDLHHQQRGDSCGIWVCAWLLFLVKRDRRNLISFNEENVDDFRVLMVANLVSLSWCYRTGSNFKFYGYDIPMFSSLKKVLFDLFCE